jgi:hypothetical protein
LWLEPVVTDEVVSPNEEFSSLDESHDAWASGIEKSIEESLVISPVAVAPVEDFEAFLTRRIKL